MCKGKTVRGDGVGGECTNTTASTLLPYFPHSLFPPHHQDPMIAGKVSKPLLLLRSEMNAESRGEDKAATSDSELNEPLLAPVESNDGEDTPSKLFGKSV